MLAAAVVLCGLGVLAPGRINAQGPDAGDTLIVHGFKYMGNASCAGAGCHAEVEAKVQSGQNIGDELNIWQGASGEDDGDAHMAAYDTLFSDDSKKIGAALKLDAVDQSPRCTVCHTTPAPVDQQGAQFKLADAIGCEACHGPSEKYLEPHAKAGWTNDQRGQLDTAGLRKAWGLIDTTDLGARAGMCVQCHLEIDKDLIDAGHPSLAFEMYSYSYYTSKNPDKFFAIHYDMPTGESIDARMWAVGQAAALASAKGQVAAWTAKGWDAADVQRMASLYEKGVVIAKAHFGADTVQGLTDANITSAGAAAAAQDLAALAGDAGTMEERWVIAQGVAALAASFFDADGKKVPDAWWDAYDEATDPDMLDNGDGYADAVQALADVAK